MNHKQHGPSTRSQARSAKIAGLIVLSGPPCKKCGLDKRYASDGHCVHCAIERVTQKNKNRAIKAQGASIIIGDPCRVCGGRERNVSDGNCTNCKRKRGLIRYYETRERYQERQKRRRQKDPEKNLKQQRNSWRRHPNTARAKWHRRRAWKLGNKGNHTAKDIDIMYEKQKCKCMICFVKLNNRYHIDHIMPLSRGGGNGPDNLQLLCASCNRKKWAHDPFDYARIIGRLL